MKDNEIIKAWGCCSAPICNCKECSMEGVVSCYVTLKHKTLDLINRQKAEIESKELIIERLKECVEEAYSEARKEIAERLKDRFCYDWIYKGEKIKEDIDNLLKEMESESDV